MPYGALVVPATKLEPEKLDQGTLLLIYEVVRDHLNKQFEQVESLNARAHQLVALAAGIFGLVVGLRAPTDDLKATLLFVPSLVVFVLLFGEGYRAWSMKRWRRDPVPATLWRRYGLLGEARVRYQLVGQWIACYEANQEQIESKVRRIRRTQVMLGILVVCLVATVLVIPYLQ